MDILLFFFSSKHKPFNYVCTVVSTVKLLKPVKIYQLEEMFYLKLRPLGGQPQIGEYDRYIHRQQ